MSKKSINHKEVTITIKTKLLEGKSKSEILQELTGVGYDKETVAQIISATPSSEARRKYKLLNNILVGLILLVGIFKILAGIVILAPISLTSIPLVLLTPILNVIFAMLVLNFNGKFYRIIGLMSLGSIGKMIGKWGGAGYYYYRNMRINLCSIILFS